MYVQQVLILTAQCAYNVSMVKNGIQKQTHVLVNLAINGVVNSAKNPMHAHKAEYGVYHSNNVSVPKDHIGEDTAAYQ